MNSIDKLFLLDAYALIYRAYYAFIKNPRINSKGFNTSAILGFVNTLEEVLKKENPTHIGVAFDPSGPTFRHEAYEQYKAQREETPEAIRLSVPIIKDIIRAYRIPILEVSGYEADDVIGTLATEAGRQGITTYMMTPDKDYGQLVSDRVFMYRPKHTGGFEVMGTEEVKTKFNIQTTEQVIDMLGLMGDASDNIPGCPGVGEKTAQKLIAEFGSIENLLEHTDQLKGALKTKVETNREMITFSKFLATIKTDVPIQLDMDSLVREEPNEEELRKIFMTWWSAIFATAVVIFPLMYRTARGAFESFDETLAYSGQTLGLSNAYIFWHIRMPCCRQGILAGTVLAFARALGEYGATSMIAGYTPGKTATISTTVYQLWQTSNDALAMKWVMVNLSISAVVLLTVNMLERRDFLVSGGKRRGTA